MIQTMLRSSVLEHVGEHGERRAGGAEQVRPARGARIARGP